MGRCSSSLHGSVDLRRVRRAMTAATHRDSVAAAGVVAGLDYRVQTTGIVAGARAANTSRKETAAINHPPTNGPTAAATPLSPDHAPMARGLSFATKRRFQQREAPRG